MNILFRTRPQLIYYAMVERTRSKSFNSSSFRRSRNVRVIYLTHRPDFYLSFVRVNLMVKLALAVLICQVDNCQI